MFKKPISLSSSHKLSGGDRKKIRKDIQLKFGCSDEELNAVLPAKGGDFEVSKLSGGQKSQVYTLDGVPLIVDTTCKNDLMPTIFALWRVPTLLPTIYVKHPTVSQYVIGGADLMLPGVLLPPGGLPKFKDWQLCCIAVPGNPAPVAVGRLLFDSDKAAERIAAGSKGRLVQSLQYYQDKMYELAINAGGPATPNAGFMADVILPLDWDASRQDAETFDYPSDAAGDGTTHLETTVNDPSIQADWQMIDVTPPLPGEIHLNPEPLESHTDDCPPSPTADPENTATSTPQMSMADMDDLLQTCLLQALHTRVTNKDLPLGASSLWANEILPCRPPGQHLDFKLSSHKKLSKFLLAQAKLGLLQVSQDKFSQEVIVQRVMRNSAIYTAFRPYKVSTLEAAPIAVQVPGVKGAAVEGKLTIEEGLRVGRELAPLFVAVGLDANEVYNPEHVKDCLAAYIDKLELRKGSKDSKHIMLNQQLADALFKGLMKKLEAYPEQIDVSSAHKAMMKRMHPVNTLRRGALEGVKKGTLPPVLISVVKRQGKKKVTIITGMETFLLVADSLSKDIKRVFACATTVQALTGPKKDVYSISAQGDIPAKMFAYLKDSWGIPAEYLKIK